MILRPYQRRWVNRVLDNLNRFGDSLGIAATGAGKTVMLAEIDKELPGKTLVLQHRQELVAQNMKKFLLINDHLDPSQYTAFNKSWVGDTVFGMQQTIAANMAKIPKFDNVLVDECHHIVAPTYAAIIDKLKADNPKLRLCGVTATAERSDNKSLRPFFSNVADQITIKELVALGHLVPPRAFVVDVGVRQDLQALKITSNFGDQNQVEDILNTQWINAEVVRHWKEQAHDRSTIIFCSTVHHAGDVCDAFKSAGVSAAIVHGGMSAQSRKSVLKQHDEGEIQVLVNVFVLTEGYDSQPVSCVILLRQCSEKGPMIQMIGRGLRTVDPSIYPGIVKMDCLVMDFGTSILTHGDLDQGNGLHEERDMVDANGDPITKECPEGFSANSVYRYPDKNGHSGCGTTLPAQTKTCPICGFLFERIVGDETFQEVDLTEIDILDASPFRYVDLYDNDLCLMAGGFEAWAGIFSPDNGDTWYALGKRKGCTVRTLAVTSRIQAIAAADDYMRSNETEGAAKKSKRWLNEPATEKQIQLLSRYKYDASNFTKYAASCHTNFQFSLDRIEQAIGVS